LFQNIGFTNSPKKIFMSILNDSSARILQHNTWMEGIMNHSQIFACFSTALLLINGLLAIAADKSRLLFSFETEGEFRAFKTQNVTVSQIATGATEGRKALKLEVSANTEGSLSFSRVRMPWDWQGYSALAIDVTNPTSEPIIVRVGIADDYTADEGRHRAVSTATLGPRETASYAYPLGSLAPMERGMRGGPPVSGTQPPPFLSANRLDERHITEFHLLLEPAPFVQSLLLDNVRLLPAVSYDGIVDALGQYTRADWPGKMKDSGEFAHRRAAEESQIKEIPTLPERDEFGGWSAGPQLPGIGFFRSEKLKDKWWLVTPNGHLFLSLGVNCVSMGEGPTLVEGREKMFTWLPNPADPLAKHYGHTREILYGPIKEGRTFDFITANLERKYGADYIRHMRDSALDRLRAWGFNTIANWSDPALYAMKRLAYTATLDVRGDLPRIASGQDYWGKMADPFDPRFRAAAEQSFRQQAAQSRDDPWCLGYFVDNEISWGSESTERTHFGLVYGTLAGTKTLVAKRAFIEELRQHYPTVERLNAVWGTGINSWEELLDQPFQPPDPMNSAMREDFSRFLKSFARQYFRIIKESLREFDPNHLYLGCRFAWYTTEAAEAAAEFCDVLSFNIYRRRIDPTQWEFVNRLNRPCIIGEFHFGAMDRGMFHTGLVSAPNQAGRADLYREYLYSLADHPAFVGCGWFEYYDEPLTGRTYDGENYNIGLLTVTDTPYPELVEMAKVVHQEIYRRRAGK
jgi:hypothetical protein